MTDFNISNYANRIIDFAELDPQILTKTNHNQYQIVSAMKKGVCQRCFSQMDGQVNGKLYCRTCINFGRIDETSKLVIFEDTNNTKLQASTLRWQGKLSSLQSQVSQDLLDSYLNYDEHLLWAVTGAGKTEILFETLNDAIKRGFRVAIISPRVDVCEELFPRFKDAFDLEISLMHGKKEDELKWTQLIIATVHQLIKFRQAFDLIIVDEVDSYPLFGNEWLQDILFRALKNNGKLIYLSATPPTTILQRVDKIYYLPQRFHGKPLPVPKPKIIGNSLQSRTIFKHIEQLIQNGQRFIMFFPSIKVLEEFGQILKERNLDFNYDLVSSESNNRLEIVQSFRDEELFALFSTTILERGVTFNNIDVLVYDSGHHNFSKEVLIQIAGRAGRQRDYFDNEVVFYYREYNRQIKLAISEIKKLNRMAEKLE